MRWTEGRSLIRQTIAVVVAAQILCAGLLGSAALLHERHTRLRALDVRLQGRSDSLLGAIQDAEDPEDNVILDPTELSLPADDIYAVYIRDGRLLGTSSQAPAGIIQRHRDEFRSERFGRIRYRVFEREAMRVIDRAETHGVGLKRPVTIVYASPEGHLWHEILEAARSYLLAIFLATAFTAFLVAVLLSRALHPLSELALAAGQLAPPALAFTPPPAALRLRELRPLASVLTDTVARLREAFAREQRFVADAAHELKTAIAVVRSSVQLLMLKRRSVEEYAAGLERILEDNRRVETLVAQMLELARVDEETPSDASPVDLAGLTASALDQLRPLAVMRAVLLSFEQPPETLVRIQPERALALISNLVMNSIQHSSPGGPVSVSLTRSHPTQIALSVQDAGAGIAADALPRIFDRFYREDRSRSRDTGGTGLGLSICKSIVEAAGGSIFVESSQESGTRVTVIFIAA